MESHRNIKKTILYIRYLQEERDECEGICDNAKLEIEHIIKQAHYDFNVYDSDLDKPESIEQPDFTSQEVPKKDDSAGQRPRWAKTLFRKIVMITHPDKVPESLNKGTKSKYLKIYQDSKIALDSKDYAELAILADDLDIDISGMAIEEVIFQKKREDLLSHISSLKSSLFWSWAHSTDEEKEKILQEFVKQRGWTSKESHRKKSRKGAGTHPGKSIPQIKRHKIFKDKN